MSLCESIDTLSMAYLDDELAAEERHELEAHLCECAACRAHLDSERSEQDLRAQGARRAAGARPAARAARAARSTTKIAACQRRRWSQYLLPGSAMVRRGRRDRDVRRRRQPTASRRSAPVAREAVRQQMRDAAARSAGRDTGAWLHANFDLDPRAERRSLRRRSTLYPRGINGHDGAKLVYRVDLGAGASSPRSSRSATSARTSSRTATS